VVEFGHESEEEEVFGQRRWEMEDLLSDER